ncbi:MAG: helix-turn-helix domain-containing protein [Lachnospiraceae bacterium]|nr:helix-turn-helix domain-containing protein [Lachnospiraceae bacterium]
MTIEETAEKLRVNKKTVEKWCEKKWIRGVKKEKNGMYNIPQSVKRPYFKRRAKGDSIYTSIVKAVLEGCDTSAALYGLSDDEYEKYICQLKDAGVIDSYVDSFTGISYL